VGNPKSPVPPAGKNNNNNILPFSENRKSLTQRIKQKVKNLEFCENGIGEEWKMARAPGMNQHYTTQILGTWRVTSRKAVAVTHRQDARSLLL
jgi:hypothetical protein